MTSDQTNISIKLLEVCGPHCISPEKGEALHRTIVPSLKSGAHVTLDFEGVQTVASLFLNPAIGRLYGLFDYAFIDSHLHLTGADEIDSRSLSIVIENAKDHYRKGIPERTRQDQLVKSIVDKKF